MTPPTAQPLEPDLSLLGIQTMRLWEADAPGAKGTAREDTPTLTVFTPGHGSGNGSAVIVVPGGGYRIVAGTLEGREIASWFAARGVKAFLLTYRLPANGYLFPAPLDDARRAMQLVRARAAEFEVIPDRIGMIGFSAGGHLAALASTMPLPGDPAAADPVEQLSSRPDFLVLGYPWLDAMKAANSPSNYATFFNQTDQAAELEAQYSPSNFVSVDSPPTFLYHTYNDQSVPVEQSLGFFEALRKAGVPAEMHIFADGPHATGLGKGNAALGQWPGLMETWLRAMGLFQKE